MKKIFTTAVLAAAMLFSANSAEAQVKFGIKGGLNVTSMSLDSKVLDAENRAGFFIGPTLKFTLPVVGLGIDASASTTSARQRPRLRLRAQRLRATSRLSLSTFLSTFATASVWAAQQASSCLPVRSSASTWAIRTSQSSRTWASGALSHLHSASTLV